MLLGGGWLPRATGGSSLHPIHRLALPPLDQRCFSAPPPLPPARLSPPTVQMALTVLLAASSYLHPLNMDGCSPQEHQACSPHSPYPTGHGAFHQHTSNCGCPLAQPSLWSARCLDISSGDIPQAARAEIFNIQHCFVSKDISKLLVPSLETSKSLCLFPFHFLYQICHEGQSILPLQFSQPPTPFIPGAPASFSSTGHSPAPFQFNPSSTSTLHLCHLSKTSGWSCNSSKPLHGSLGPWDKAPAPQRGI